jgi:hypothetical protein
LSKIEVDTVEPQSGTSLTLGASGDTITIPSGATLDASNATLTLPDDSVTTAKIDDGAVTTVKIADSNITTAKLAYDPNPFRNIVINGDMSIAQRSTSVASITTSDYHTLDRYQTVVSSLGTWTQSQSTDVPTGEGFATSLKMDCTTADATPSAGDYLFIRQMFEGQNLQYLKKGTANAVSLTASFWVKSTKTGTFVVQLYDNDNNRSVSGTYTVNTTNTWEYKTITFPPDTTGAFDNDNADSLQLRFWLAAGTNFTSGTLNTTWAAKVDANQAVGQVNIADDTSNDFYITGVQLEAGTTASDFEFLPYDVNLNRCLRYYYKEFVGSGKTFAASVYATSATNAKVIGKFPVILRTDPSGLEQSGTANHYAVRAYSERTCTAVPIFVSGTNKYAWICDTTVASGQTAGNGGDFLSPGADGYLAWSAEL